MQLKSDIIIAVEGEPKSGKSTCVAMLGEILIEYFPDKLTEIYDFSGSAHDFIKFYAPLASTKCIVLVDELPRKKYFSGALDNFYIVSLTKNIAPYQNPEGRIFEINVEDNLRIFNFSLRYLIKEYMIPEFMKKGLISEL